MKNTNKMKRICIVFQLLLMIWFFLDMTGLYIGGRCLVTRSYRDDGIFFLIYLATVILFCARSRIGKWFVAVWTCIWFLVQFLSHEWYTIFNTGIMGGSADGKTAYYADTIKLITINGRYVPDLYHLVLHVLILFVFISASVFVISNRRKK